MPAPCQTIRSFNRFELKYLLTLQQAAQFRKALQAYLRPDDHSRGSYALSSLYYDSPGLHCYREKVDGLKVRRKLRIRHYETGQVLTDETPVFIEIKQRYDRTTQKRRALLPYREALRLCNNREIPEHDPQDRALIEEVYAFLWHYDLRPMSIVRYNRLALVSTAYDIGLRVTFDTSLTTQANPLHLHEAESGMPILGANWVVMEIKINEHIPCWLSEMVAAYNLHTVGVSKYCRSIEAIQEMPYMQYRHLSPEWSEDALASSLSVFRGLGQTVNVENEKKKNLPGLRNDR